MNPPSYPPYPCPHTVVDSSGAYESRVKREKKLICSKYWLNAKIEKKLKIYKNGFG